MNINGRVPAGEPTVASSVSGMAHDSIEIAQLQAELFVCDIKSTGQKARTSLILGVIGVCVLLGSLPVALIALAELLIDEFGWAPAAGYGAAALGGLLLSGLFLAAAYARVKAGIVMLERSRQELSRNIEWLKTQLSRTRHRAKRGTV